MSLREKALLLIPLAALGLGCRRERPNVLLVTFDTTRWDHVGYARGRQGVTPMLDAMAARGTWFSTCLAAQPLTLPSHTSILSGLYPYRHGVRNNGTYVVPEQVVTLAERLREAGYATHAIVSSFVLDSQFGLDQGFDAYDDDLSGGPKQKMFMFKEIGAQQTAEKAVAWLERERPRDRPFFLWVHFFDPHADYAPPLEVAARFPGDPYSGEIHYADRELGRVIKSLDDARLLPETLFVFTSDHGDGLGEHGEKTHGIFIYDSTTRVPLVLAGPGVPAGRRVDALARSVDIVPTLLELLRLESSPSLDGSSLRPLWRGTQEERTAVVESFSPLLNFGWSELRAVRSRDWKVIAAPRPEAYDLAADPGEGKNLLAGAAAVPAPARPLFAELRAWTAKDPFGRGEQQPGSLDAETRQKLQALGYVWATADVVRAQGSRPDPKDRIAFWERFQAAQAMIRQDAYGPAAAAIRQLLAEDPDNVLAMGSLALALAHTGDKPAALALYRRMIQLDTARESPYLGAARLLRESGEFAEAETLVLAVVERQPENPVGYVALGDVFLEQARFAEAENWFRKSLQVDPHSTLAASGLGNCLNRAGRPREAFAVLKAAHERDPTSHGVAYNLAVVSERLGDRTAAMQLYQLAIRLEPDHSMSWNNLGSMLDRVGRREDALRLLAKAHALDPENVEATYNLGALLLAKGEAARALPYLEAALRLKADLRAAQAARARALAALGRRQDALRAWEQIAAHAPAAWLQVARLELLAGRGQEARAAVRLAIAQGGERVRALVEQDPRLRGLAE